jgi:hypothetical protein
VCIPRAVGIVGPVVVVAILFLASCSSDAESPDVAPSTGAAPAESPTTVTVAPTAEPTTTVATGAASTPTEAPAETKAPAATDATATTVPTATSLVVGVGAASSVAAEPTPRPVLSPLPPASEVSYDQQKELLSTLVKEWFVGVNNAERPRLKLLPDVRDNRRGGILVHIEINGDEYDTTTLKKAELDKLMRDTYELIYTTGYEVTEVAITAIMDGVRHATAKSASIERIQVFRSRLRGDVALTVDWANKESLDFNDIWETMLLNTAWKRELAEEAEASQ